MNRLENVQFLKVTLYTSTYKFEDIHHYIVQEGALKLFGRIKLIVHHVESICSNTIAYRVENSVERTWVFGTGNADWRLAKFEEIFKRKNYQTRESLSTKLLSSVHPGTQSSAMEFSLSKH